MKKFIQNYKSYIIAVILVSLSIISIIIQNNKEESIISINGESMLSNDEDKIAVYISGEVVNPGVYYVEHDSRLDNLIELCGGITEEADMTKTNLAKKLNDSDMVVIPKISSNQAEIDDYNDSSLININSATLTELMTLSGIGESTAGKIIEYRKNSKFNSIEEIMNVDGIGQSKYSKIKEYICVD